MQIWTRTIAELDANNCKRNAYFSAENSSEIRQMKFRACHLRAFPELKRHRNFVLVPTFGLDLIPQADLGCFVQVTSAQRVIAARQASTSRTVRLGIIAAMMNANRIRRSAAMTVTSAQRVIVFRQASTSRTVKLDTADMMIAKRIRRSAAMTVICVF